MNGSDGEDGATFTPSVSEAGVLSWTNDGGLTNPEPVSIKGPPGADGASGEAGPAGPAGETGQRGEPGVGVPTGGMAGQFLKKVSGTDYDTQWADPPEGGGDTTYLLRAPVGTIVIWSGTADNIPTGWQLCDGTNGTPDLRDKFVLGAGNKYAVGATGGSEEVTLTVAQMPLHTHGIAGTTSAGSGEYRAQIVKMGTNITQSATTAGGSESHPNMPPYYALCYIMKLTADETDGVLSINGEAGVITLTAGDNVSITKTGKTITISATGGGGSTLQSLAITTPPDKTRYKAGETFDPTGMTATATFSDGSTVSVSSDGMTYAPDGPLLVTDTAVTASFSFGGKTATAEQPITVVAVNIYGAEWDGTSTTAWSRTDDSALFTDPVPYVAGAETYGSPFDNLQPWAGMVKEERTGGTMVKVPKFWYKLTQNGAGLKIQIADSAAEGFVPSPMHMDRGDGKGERDVAYMGRYHCASDFKSKTGVKPKVSTTRADFRTGIHNLGANIWQGDFAMAFTLWLLYTVEYANWNSQETIGYGCGNGSAVENMGSTDTMPYHTGTMRPSRTEYGVGVQYRYIEEPWGNCFDWYDGCYNNASGLNIILNPNDFSDTTGGVPVGVPSNGFPSAFSVKTGGEFPMFIPTEANGSDSMCSCDGWDFAASNPAVCGGGSYGQNGSCGLFCVSYTGAAGASANGGSRLQELP